MRSPLVAFAVSFRALSFFARCAKEANGQAHLAVSRSLHPRRFEDFTFLAPFKSEFGYDPSSVQLKISMLEGAREQLVAVGTIDMSDLETLVGWQRLSPRACRTPVGHTIVGQ